MKLQVKFSNRFKNDLKLGNIDVLNCIFALLPKSINPFLTDIQRHPV